MELAPKPNLGSVRNAATSLDRGALARNRGEVAPDPRLLPAQEVLDRRFRPRPSAPPGRWHANDHAVPRVDRDPHSP
jgi:hypothetical protein